MAKTVLHVCGAATLKHQPWGEVLVVPSKDEAAFDIGWLASNMAWSPYDFGVLTRHGPIVITLDAVDNSERPLPKFELIVIAVEIPRIMS
jgi:hypothetical protein